jgi:hypothetical protein
VARLAEELGDQQPVSPWQAVKPAYSDT